LLLILFSNSISGSNSIIQDSNKFATKQVAEKVYLHIDRKSYTSGDDIWFKAYVIDPSTNRLSENTNNLHVELISPEAMIILHHSFKDREGYRIRRLQIERFDSFRSIQNKSIHKLYEELR
jgi:hypothetical protein